MIISLLGDFCRLRIRLVAILIGWLENILSSLKIYALVAKFKHTLGEDKAASTSIGSISAILKTPRIFLMPRF